ncbi:MAG: Fur family transcriptional regulator [Steroidobacteraceae bacterium]
MDGTTIHGVPRQHLAERLRGCGIQPTQQRLRIAAILLATPQHITAEQIQARLAALGTRVSKATVYNTLKVFADNGLIGRLCVDGTRTYFDSNTQSHYHFHDPATARLIDFPLEAIEFSRLPPLPDGTEIAGIDVVIRLRRPRENP